MKKYSGITAVFLILSFSLSAALLLLPACGWNPKVKAVPVTAPWSGMNLPVKENAVVWHSSDDQFKAVHIEDKRTVTRNYTEALKAQGWTVNSFDVAATTGAYETEMRKGAEKLSIRVYDLDKTGIIIEKK